ncbi:hypothetical protein HMPREF1870_02383 [Bacteroidales bacterium KA00344]|nr:hypothetical protein HMPREF1870_02383 [Bacteroidales bacterium KA00344]
MNEAVSENRSIPSCEAIFRNIYTEKGKPVRRWGMKRIVFTDSRYRYNA